MYNSPVNHGDMWTIVVWIADSTGAYVHGLSHIPREGSPELGLEDFSTSTGEDGARMSQPSVVGEGRPGSMPFVSHRPGDYGRLLLAVYVRWKTGLLVASDWLRPVTRGGGGGGWRLHTSCWIWWRVLDCCCLFLQRSRLCGALQQS